MEGGSHWDLNWSKMMTTSIKAAATTTSCGILAKRLCTGDVSEGFLVRPMMKIARTTKRATAISTTTTT